MQDLLDFWTRHEDQRLALCTLVKKQGSSYCALGAKKLVAIDQPDSCGLLSGGCLEADIEETARKGWSRMPFVQSFSTLSETDRLLGYQTGCAGIIDLLFERLSQEQTDKALYIPYGPAGEIVGNVIIIGDDPGRQKAVATVPEIADDQFFDPWVTPIALYIIGCGSDAPAFAELARPLGWHVHFIDYRSDHQLPMQLGIQAEHYPLADIADHIDQGLQTAIVLMTHNYEADMALIADLHKRQYGYLGCLGPAKRYQQIKEDLLAMRGITIDRAWEPIVHAPAGLIPGQRTPETIALSIIAQIQQVLHG